MHAKQRRAHLDLTGRVTSDGAAHVPSCGTQGSIPHRQEEGHALPVQRPVYFVSEVGNLVLRLRQSSKGRHKLTPPWEGPYIVAQVLKPRTYKLANEKGKILTNAWNIEQLHCFYL